MRKLGEGAGRGGGGGVPRVARLIFARGNEVVGKERGLVVAGNAAEFFLEGFFVGAAVVDFAVVPLGPAVVNEPAG